MKISRLSGWVALFALVGAGLPSARAADAAAGGTPKVMKILTTSADKSGFPMPGGQKWADKKEAGWVVAAPADGGKAIKYPISDAFRDKLDEFANAKGQIVNVTFTSGKSEISGMTKAEAGKAALNPRAYEFNGTGQIDLGGQGHVTLKVTKAGQPKEIPVANKTGAAGATPQPDAALAARIAALKSGDMVELATTLAKNTAMVVDVMPIVDPAAGEFVKLTSVRDPSNKIVPGIVIEIGQEQWAYTLPAAGPAGGMAPNTVATISAMSRRLKPGYGVQFLARAIADPSGGTPAATAIAPTTAPAGKAAVKTVAEVPRAAALITDLKIDGKVEATGEKTIEINSSYVRIDFSERRDFGGGGFGGFGNGGGGFGGFGGFGRGRGQDNNNNNASPDQGKAGDIEVRYYPGGAKDDKTHLVKGIDRVLDSEEEAKKLGINAETAKKLEELKKSLDRKKADGADKNQWLAAYKSWMAATDDESRKKIEQEMLIAAQELSQRLKKDVQTADAGLKSLLKPDQIEGLEKLGAEDRGFGGFPTRGRGR